MHPSSPLTVDHWLNPLSLDLSTHKRWNSHFNQSIGALESLTPSPSKSWRGMRSRHTGNSVCAVESFLFSEFTLVMCVILYYVWRWELPLHPSIRTGVSTEGEWDYGCLHTRRVQWTSIPLDSSIVVGMVKNFAPSFSSACYLVQLAITKNTLWMIVHAHFNH